MSIRRDILTTVEVIAEDPTRSDIVVVKRLMEEGYDLLHAELLTVFVPLGLGRALIERMNFRPAIKLSDKAILQDSSYGERSVHLAHVPEFQVALELGRETFITGLIPRDQFSAATSIGVEMKIINEILYAGHEPDGTLMSSPVLTRLARAPGFEEWYLSLPTN